MLDFVHAFDRPEMKDAMVRSLLTDLLETGCMLRAFVVMANHIHFVATLRETIDGRKLMNRIKSNSAKRILALMSEEEHRRLDHQRGLNGRAFWKVSFRSLPPYTGVILDQKINYTHQNPVRANLCSDIVEYHWSLARFWQDEKCVGTDYELDIAAILAEFAPVGGGLLFQASTDSCDELPGSRE